MSGMRHDPPVCLLAPPDLADPSRDDAILLHELPGRRMAQRRTPDALRALRRHVPRLVPRGILQVVSTGAVLGGWYGVGANHAREIPHAA